jgi:hypothetical protein
MPKIVTSKSSVVRPLFESMSREHLASTAKALGVNVGKSKGNTVDNMVKATATGQAQVKVYYTISFKPADGSAQRRTFYSATLRTYVSGPGEGNAVQITPDNAIAGSPGDSSES